MATASFNGRIIAESNDTTFVEGNHYFPMDSLDQSVVTKTDRSTTCHWKGTASYYSIEVDGQVADNAAWYYPDPIPGADDVAGRVAFYQVIEVTA